jgi:hypothetical protein
MIAIARNRSILSCLRFEAEWRDDVSVRCALAAGSGEDMRLSDRPPSLFKSPPEFTQPRAVTRTYGKVSRERRCEKS